MFLSRPLFSDIISQILFYFLQVAGKNKINLGATTPSRDFTYVADTVAGFVAALRAVDIFGEIINLGSGQEITIGELVEKIVAQMNRSVTIETDQKRIRPEKSEVTRLVCDPQKAARLLKWHSLLSLDEGLQKTIDWFSQPENLAGYKPERYGL